MKTEIIIKTQDILTQAEIVKILKKISKIPRFKSKFKFEVKILE